MTSRPPAFAAVDLGASSGRVVRGEVIAARAKDDGPTVVLEEVARFPNSAEPDELGTLRWDIDALYDGILTGLREAGERGGVDSIGIDTWAVDYGLLDSAGELLAPPVAYRDRRHEDAVSEVHARISPAELYQLTGLQHLPFNTIYQLAAESREPLWDRAAAVLLIPDLIAYRLTGTAVAERTNASTTGLLDVRRGEWSQRVLESIGLDPARLRPLVSPGTRIGPLTPQVAHRTGLGPVPVIAVGSHDTASAIVGIPAEREDFAYISCGTWSLVGVELSAPVLTEASRAANFTNELGVDGTIRYLRNVMGLWVLQECQRLWAGSASPTIDTPATLPELLAAAEQVPALRTVVDIDHPDFLAPGDMPARLAAHARRTGQPEPRSRGEVVRCILDSLAVAYRRAVRAAHDLSGRSIEVVHVVGGGALNALLMQATADATGRVVIAGPEESTGLGNVLVQARAAGVLGPVAEESGDTGGPSLSGLRAIAARGVSLRTFRPATGGRVSAAWDEAESRAHEVIARA